LTPRRILLVYAALALLTAFYPALFGELPVPASGGLLVLPDARRAAELNELGDVPTQFLPWSRAVADAYRSGHLPFRLAANGCGTPLWANPQAQAVTPTTLFHLILPEAWASAAAAAAKLCLAASGAFLFLRGLGLSSAAAGWAAFAFGFSLHMTGWMHFPHTWPLSLLPWTLLALSRVARGRPGGFFAAFAAVLALLLGGYPEAEFYVALATAVFFVAVLVRAGAGWREASRRFGIAAAASLLALGLTAAYNLPAFHALAGSERARLADRGSLAAPAPPLTARDLVRPPTYWEVSRFWVAPEAQGNPRDGDKFGPYSFAGRASGYSGILIVAFALATLFWRRAPAPVAFARGALLVLALYVLWYPPLSHVLQTAPGIRQAAVRLTTNRANTIAVLLLVLLAAFELDRIRAGGRTLTTRLGIAVALLGLTAAALEYARAAGRPPLTAWRAFSFAFPAIALVSVFVALAWRGPRRRLDAVVPLLWILTGVDLLRVGVRFNPGTLPSDYFPVTPFVREVQSAASGGRFAGASPALTGVAYMYGLEDVRVHDPVAPSEYVDTLVATVGYAGPGEYAPRVTRLEAQFLSFLNVRARFGDASRVEVASPTPPRATFPERLLGARDAGELRERMGRETDFAHHAFALGGDEAFSGASAVLSFEKPRPERLRIRVRSGAPRLLVVPESDDGGWTAEANGKSLPTLTVNGAFLAIRVPAGETEVVCRYVPPGFREGVAISAVSTSLLAALAFARRRGPAASIPRRPAR
jgi:hypothetical protein